MWMQKCWVGPKDIVTKSGKKMPQVFTGSAYAWKDMLSKNQLDGVIIATPWEWHKPMVIGSLEAGIQYVGTEVILGITLERSLGCCKGC
jgi:predicted dehydrogenase